MNGLSRCLAAVLAVTIAAILVAWVSPARADKRVALVVGNDDYQNIPKLL